MRLFVVLVSLFVSTIAYGANPLTAVMPVTTTEKEARLLTCGKGYIGEVCKITMETSGFSSGTFVEFFQREDLGRLILIKAIRLDASNKAVLTLRFKDTAPFNLVALVVENRKAVALDGAVIDVYPDKTQLGEQFIPSFTIEAASSTTYSEEPSDDETGPPEDAEGSWD